MSLLLLIKFYFLCRQAIALSCSRPQNHFLLTDRLFRFEGSPAFGLGLRAGRRAISSETSDLGGNQLRWKPYRYGGGHKTFFDRGYDCSGTISYVLARCRTIAKAD